MKQTYILLPPQPFCKDDIALFQIIQNLLHLLDEHFKRTENDNGYNCHVFVRAFARIFNQRIQFVDGYYIQPDFKVEKSSDDKPGLNVVLKGGLLYDHSWLRTQNGSIIDIYPMGVFTSSPLMYQGTESTFFESSDFEVPSETEELAEKLFEELSIIACAII